MSTKIPRIKHICANCCHWNREARNWIEGLAGACNSPKFHYMDGVAIQPGEFLYWDSEGYHASIATEASFGCNHWERKDEGS